jgi:hypothetical protein
MLITPNPGASGTPTGAAAAAIGAFTAPEILAPAGTTVDIVVPPLLFVVVVAPAVLTLLFIAGVPKLLLLVILLPFPKSTLLFIAYLFLVLAEFKHKTRQKAIKRLIIDFFIIKR